VLAKSIIVCTICNDNMAVNHSAATARTEKARVRLFPTIFIREVVLTPHHHPLSMTVDFRRSQWLMSPT
jgi:hypothetical protein